MSAATELSNTDQVTYWNEVAGAKWVANQTHLDCVFAPLTRALIEAAALKARETILDVGCGCGETSLLVASHMGPEGRVLAIDLSKPMLDHARTRVDAAAAPITWLQADAMTYAFTPDADLMISRFGVMFFADPIAAFTNLRRGIKPGGRFAFLCWRPRPDVAWMQWPLDQIATVLPTPEPTMSLPGPFGLADRDFTRGVLTRAGFTDLTVTPVDAPLTIGAGPDAVGDAMALLRDTGPVAVLLRDAEPAARVEAEVLLRKGLEDQARGGSIVFGGACWLYQGMA